MSAGAGAAAAAAEAERRRREEEEEMTSYSEADLAEGWEFKILRSSMAAFRKPEELRRACEEEAKAGWQLVEKFDNERLRFKRLVSARANDDLLGFDPYRTYIGMAPSTLALVVVVGTVVVIAIVAFILFVIAKG